MGSPEVHATGAGSRAQTGEADRDSLGPTTGESVATGTEAPTDSSTFSDIRACVELLDRVWPREDLPPPSPRQIPETLGRFRILRELGRGGFGVVFLAEDPLLGRRLALKVPRVEVLSHKDAWQRFLREAMAASRLDHPNLVPLLETGEIGAVGYIASVYVEGPSLEAWLAQRQQPVPFHQAARLIATLARAMDHAHQRGILHRDLKPANVLLQETSGEGPASSAHGSGPLPFVPRICDFGLAKLLDIESEETRSTVAAGSPSYMAPEQAEGRKAEIGPATDVYGLGAILYELITRRPPFRGQTSLEILRKVVAEEPVPPRRTRPKVPRDLETVCLKCLAKPPKRRYSSVAELADDLDRYLEGRPIQARPVPVWERAWKWARRRPALATLLVVSTLAIAAVLVGQRRYNMVLAGKNEEIGKALVQARINEQEALAQKRLADERGQQARRQVAGYRVRQAQTAVESGNLELARSLLDSAGPELGPSGARGFAWDYLDRQVRSNIHVLEGHEAPVQAVAVSLDGRTLASGDSRGGVRLWDLVTGGCRILRPAHQAGVVDLSFSPDGRTLASTTGFHTGELYLWDVATGKFLGGVPPSDQYFYLSMFSADGKSVAALQPAPANHPRRTLVWDCANPEACPMMPDGQRLRGMGLHNPWIGDIAGLLDDGSRTTGLRPVLEEPGPRGLAFTRDGTVCVIGKGDGTFQLRAAWCGLQFAVGRITSRLGREFLFFRTGNPKVDELADRLANSLGRAACESQVAVRRASDLKITVHAAFSPGGRDLALWREGLPGPFIADPATVRERAAYRFGVCNQLSPLTFTPDGRTLVFGAVDHRVRLWHWNPPSDPPAPQGHGPKEAWAAAFSPDGRTLATAGDDGFIRLWDPASGSERARLRGHPSLVTSVAWSPDGATLASAEWDNALRLWDVASRKSKAVLRGHTGHLRVVAFSADGRFVATGSDDHTVRLWNATAGRSLARLTVHTEPVFAVAFSPDGRSLATGALDGRLLLWDLATLQSKQIASGPQVFRLAFTPDGKTLVSSHENAPPQVWDLATGRARTPLLGHSGDVRDLAVSPDGLTLATAGKDQTVRVWDLTNGQELLCLAGHQAWVNGVAFSPDGRMLASVDHKGAVKLWRAADP